MKCPICGKENKNDTKFCINCGYKFEKKQADQINTYNPNGLDKFESNNRAYADSSNQEYDRKGTGPVKRLVIAVVAVLIVGGAGAGLLKSGLLNTSNDHYSRSLKKASDSDSKESKEAATIDNQGLMADEDTTEDSETESSSTEVVTEITKATEETQSTTTEIDSKNNTNSNGNQEITLPGVEASNRPDYDNYLSPDNYESLTIDSDFSFSYPSGFFSKVEKYNKNYTFSTSDNSDTLYISCEPGSGDAIKDVKDASNKNTSLINAKEEKHGVLVVSDKVKDGWAHCIVGGNYTDGQNGNGMYKVIVSNGSNIYTLDFEYGSSDNSTYYTAQNYMLECMYRYCEHSGTSYKPRTWEMFSNDQMGEKKTGSSTTEQNIKESKYVNNNKQPFYGIWTEASKDLSIAEEYKAKYKAKNLDCSIFLTSEWSNLNQENWYALCVGVYSSKKEAEKHLSEVQKEYSEAYVKYSGDFRN